MLAQPVCASAAERNWSVYGTIKTASRSQMSHAVADKRVFCHEALAITRKLQSAGYKQSVEKWDSDSDSDASDSPRTRTSRCRRAARPHRVGLEACGARRECGRAVGREACARSRVAVGRVGVALAGGAPPARSMRIP